MDNTNCGVNHDTSNQNNGLITKIWGGPAWIFCHSITFGYPIEPTDEQKQNYKNFFLDLGNVLPCRYCRESYTKFISEGKTKLTDNVLANRTSLTKWFYNIHNIVNNKLGVEYGVEYEDMVGRYESFRAKCSPNVNANGCVSPLDYKAYSYKKVNQKDCPIVSPEIIGPFIVLAKIRKIDEKLFDFYNEFSKMKKSIFKIKNLELWTKRNEYCQNQIKFMRESGCSCVEQNGIWKGTPTLEELDLLVHYCTTLSSEEISECIITLYNIPEFINHVK